MSEVVIPATFQLSQSERHHQNFTQAVKVSHNFIQVVENFV